MASLPSDTEAPRARRCRMSATWLALFVAANLALAALGPRIEAGMPPSRAVARPGDKGIIYSTNMEGTFRSHLLSRAKLPGETRVIYSGNSAVAPPRLADELQRHLALRNPSIRVYGLAWPGLPATGQVLFLRRGLRESPDWVFWMISLVDCQWSPNLAGAGPGEERLVYCAGLATSVSNLRYASRDNAVAITHDIVAQALPYVRYRWALRHALPPLPDLDPRGALASEEEGGDYKPPDAVAFPPSRFRPETATGCIEALYRELPPGCSLALIVMPHRDPDAWFGPGNFEAYKEELHRWAEPRGVPLIDLSETLPPEAFHDMVHYGRRYCADVAEALARQLPPALAEGTP